MEISLSYYPILHTSPINRNGLCVFKLAGHVTQKFAFIGSDGVLKYYRFDKNILSQRYESNILSNSNECVIASDDNVIVSQMKGISRYNRKGAHVKTYKIPFDNHITSMIEQGSYIHVASGTMSYTVGVQESAIAYDSPIIGFAVVNNVPYAGIASGNVYSFVPGQSQLVQTLPGSLTMISSVHHTKTDSYLAVGCSDKKLRFYNKLDKEVSSVELQSPATAMSEFDIDKDGYPELFVAMENGNVCLISLALIESPRVLSSISIGFSATNIEAGYIYSANLVSAVVTSQSGHIGIVSAEPRRDRSLLTSIAPKVTEQELDQLRREISALENISKNSSYQRSIVPVQTKMELRGDIYSQSFVMIVESEKPISRVSIGANLPITVKSRNDCQTTIFTAKRKAPNSSAVIVPVDPNATRITFDISYETGQGGELQAFVNYAGSATVFSKEYQLRPFGLLKKLPTNPLETIKDDSLAVVDLVAADGASSVFHSIVANCFPIPLEEDVTASFSMGVVGAPLSVTLNGDKLTARSLFLPLVIQIRSYILGAMNSQKQSVTFETHLGPNCVNEFFNYIEKRFFEVNKAASDHMKLTALKEVRNSTMASTSIQANEETARLMAESQEIEKKYEECSAEYFSYIDVIHQFYIEMWKIENINSANCIEELDAVTKEAIDGNSLTSLINFMKASPPK
ncbi:hypothetical protein TVAG_238820 [Trichomonas vaginalis G3]|uniref:BBS7 helical hairpin domain-containing protein n=1 Tax=Trichomonas vaginalis (strain ATCC PRA-98 / G3) TaxID=412133 RepID=A2DGB4_TRIV3|nr:Bardet-biedl syndrome protein 7 family [Trichomonas vaginalis G3]EAY20510.1 hypothetical protein TVAG_238820 [Trichomonas vaginalis G3]KAI5488314.1 Bardet-biedl syndrome protein 7 family [Trichomonas vaginalis G3]|eukprot:XP_001581496.1 hypothetical protein [Trichomonas vaginalis G3]